MILVRITIKICEVKRKRIERALDSIVSNESGPIHSAVTNRRLAAEKPWRKFFQVNPHEIIHKNHGDNKVSTFPFSQTLLTTCYVPNSRACKGYSGFKWSQKLLASSKKKLYIYIFLY